MANKHSNIFDRASRELDEKSFLSWLCAAYGVIESSITEAQASLLEKFLEQDLEAQKLIKNKT